MCTYYVQMTTLSQLANNEEPIWLGCTTTVLEYHGTRVPRYVHVYYVRTSRYYNVMSQLSDWKRAHMCTDENHVCFGRIHGSQLRVRTYTYVVCHNVPWYHGIVYHTIIGTMVPPMVPCYRYWYSSTHDHGTRVPYYRRYGTRVHFGTRVPWYGTVL